MNDPANPRGPARYANGRFGPGNPGRKLGSRNRMSKAIALGLLQHYRDHEAEILDQLYRVWFSDYIRLIGRMLPREPKESAFDLDTLTPEETTRTVEALRGVLDRIDAGEATLSDFESVLSGETEPDNGESTVASAPAPSAAGQAMGVTHNGDQRAQLIASAAPLPPQPPPSRIDDYPGIRPPQNGASTVKRTTERIW
jgi:hypothetical protein